MPRFGDGPPTPAEIWAAVTRTLTAFDAAALGVPADVWAAAVRTLTDISAEEVFDLPPFDSTYVSSLPISSATADTFGTAVQISADVGSGKRLIHALVVGIPVAADADVTKAELEFRTGTTVLARCHYMKEVISTVGYLQPTVFMLFAALTDDSELTIRIKDNVAVAIGYRVMVHIA